MKIKERIAEVHKNNIQEFLCTKSFVGFLNPHCPGSFFYTLTIGHKTIYVRLDMELHRKKFYYEVESWVRDNSKSIFAKDLDTPIFFTAKNESVEVFKKRVEEVIKIVKEGI